MNPNRRKSVVRSIRLSPKLNDQLIEMTRRENAKRRGDTPAFTVTHMMRVLMGHGIHRFVSGCNCSANRTVTNERGSR